MTRRGLSFIEDARFHSYSLACEERKLFIFGLSIGVINGFVHSRITVLFFDGLYCIAIFI